MKFAILKLILWPREQRFLKREVSFEQGKINLVTGQSGTGKSAILHIIDYALGSSKCAIPVGPIRDTVGWYGLLVDLGHTKMLVARREPGDQVQSGDYFLRIGDEGQVPDSIIKNSSLPSFKNYMDQLAGLPTINFDAQESGNRFLSRPGFRDMAAFNFLPQHIVANPYALFFKADTSEHRAKLATIFPFVLGAVSVRHLAAEHEYAQLEKLGRKLTSEYRQRLRAGEVWKAEIFGLYERATELGLIASDATAPTNTSECVTILAAIPRRLQGTQVPLPPPGATEQASARLQGVREEESQVATALSDVRRRISRINNLQRSTHGFGQAVENGAHRVQGVGWFQRTLKEGAECPVCGSTHDTARGEIRKLARAASELMEHQRKAKDVPVALEREYKELTGKASALDERLRELRLQRVEQEAIREASGGQRLDQVYRFAGRIEQSLLNLDQSDDNAELRQHIDATNERLAELGRLLDAAEKRRRLEVALRLVSQKLMRYADLLKLERSGDAISLRIDELTLIFENPATSRTDYLWEIGSGANWMGYHISTMLALHLQFLDMERSFVPTFLVIDQPSQVYFPSGIPTNAEDESDDVVATRKIFELLGSGLRDSGYQLQIIVTEHADERTLQGIPSLHIAADWHGKDKDWLIPRAWIDG